MPLDPLEPRLTLHCIPDRTELGHDQFGNRKENINGAGSGTKHCTVIDAAASLGRAYFGAEGDVADMVFRRDIIGLANRFHLLVVVLDGTATPTKHHQAQRGQATKSSI